MFDSFAAVSVNRPEGVQLATWDTGATEGSAAPLPTVVILHGLAGSSAEFIRTADELRYRYRVILVDQRGHGRSTRRPEDTSRQAFVDDAIAVIEQLAGGPVTLVGQSMGAHTAMLVAALRPDLVDALVLLEGIAEGVAAADVDALGDYLSSWPVPFANAEDAASFLGKSPLAAAWLADLEETADGLRPRFDPDVMRATQSAMTARREPEWASVLAPTLAIFADGGLFTDSQKLALFAARPGTHRVDLVHASHDAHLDAYDQWIAALWDFLLRERED